MPMSFQGPPAPPSKWKQPAPWLTLLGMSGLVAAFIQGGDATKAVAAGGFALLAAVGTLVTSRG